jgi:hypothetical protein
MKKSNWLIDLFKKKTPSGGLVTKPEPVVQSCSCDTDKYSVCVYPKGWFQGEPLEFKNLCKQCIKTECDNGAFVEFL